MIWVQRKWIVGTEVICRLSKDKWFHNSNPIFDSWYKFDPALIETVVGGSWSLVRKDKSDAWHGFHQIVQGLTFCFSNDGGFLAIDESSGISFNGASGFCSFSSLPSHRDS